MNEAKQGYVIIASAIMIALIGTFFVSNAVTGFATAKKGVEKSSFADITGKAIGVGTTSGFRAAVSSVFFGLLSITALVVVARIGQNAITTIKESQGPSIKQEVEKAEKAVEEGNHPEAYALYTSIRQLYAQLEEKEKARHYQRIMQVHNALARQATAAEANYLTEKYVNGTIAEEEFERLKQIITTQ